MSHNVDIFPTLLDLAGISIPAHLAGRSLKAALLGKDTDDTASYVFAAAAYSDLPEDYWDNPEPYYDPDNPVPFHTRVENLTWKHQYYTAMVRTREWKLILSETHEPELYHLAGSRQEKNNLYGSTEYQEIFTKLKLKIQANWDWQKLNSQTK